MRSKLQLRAPGAVLAALACSDSAPAPLFQVIKNGGASVGRSAMMAPWGGSLSDAQIRDVIAYLRSLAH